MKRKLFSLFLAICMMLSLVPVTVFAVGENNGKLTFKCQSNAGKGGQIWYQLNCTGDFVQVTTTESGDDYEPISLTDELGSASSVAIKFVPSEGYQLDTTRGVKLSVNGNEKFSVTGDVTEGFVGVSGYELEFADYLGETETVAESTFELEFGFESKQQQDPPVENNGKLSFGGIDVTRGKIEYKFNENDDFTAVGTTTDSESQTQSYDSVDLGENSSITVKISPAAKTATTEGYRIDTVYGVKLWKNGQIDESQSKSGEALDSLMGENEDGSVYYILTFALSDVKQSNFELDFNYENDNFTDGGGRPHENDGYLGTIKKTKLTITGDVNVCINDSILINENDASSKEIPIQYHYNGGKVDFYIQCRLTERYTAITINGEDYYSQLPTPETPEGRQALLDACKGQLNEFKLTVPYSKDGYVISAKIKELDDSDKDYMQVGNFLWRYDTSENEDDLIENGKMELINVEYGGNTYTKEQLTNDASAFHWTEDENGGEAVLPAGATVTVKIVPDAGYQLTSFSVNGFGFGTGEEQSVFTFTVEQGNFHLGAKITSVEDLVQNNSDAVSSGEIKLGSGEIDKGSAVLSVETAGDTNKTGFETKLAEYDDLSGYKIGSILDISLNQVFYKGTEDPDNAWKTPMNDLDSPADITLDLMENFKNVVVLHKHGETYEKLDTTFENGKISFSTKQFSEFALAVELMNPDDGGCFKVGFDNRGDGNSAVKAKLSSGEEFSVSPNTWDKWYQYDDGSKAITFTVTVPEDRKGNTPIIEAEIKDKPDSKKTITPTKNSDGSYKFTITPNTLFSQTNPSVDVFINWTEYDSWYPDKEQAMIQTNTSGDGNGTISVSADKNISLGSETKFFYNTKPEGDLTVNFKPANEHMFLYGFEVQIGYGERTNYGFENGQELPAVKSDGSYDFTVSFGEENYIYIEAVFRDKRVANPVISPNGGTFSSSKTVEITCATDGADIYFTTDGSDPTTESDRFTEPFTISESTTVKAIAVKDGMENSEVVTAKFTKKTSTGGTGSSGGSSGGSGGSSGGSSTPTNPTVDGKEQTWTDVAGGIEKLPEGTTETISLNGNKTVPENVIKAIAASNAEVTFKVDSTFSWTIDGSDIDTTDAKAADLSISKTTVVGTSELRGTVGTGFTIKGTNVNSQLNINFKATHSGEFANLFKKVDGKLVFIDNVKIDENGSAIGLEVSEKGEYVVMLGKFSDRPGDMDNDGIINPKDSYAVLKDFVEIEKGVNPLVADMNNDGFINPKDALIILKKYIGLE